MSEEGREKKLTLLCHDLVVERASRQVEKVLQMGPDVMAPVD